jgi:hypothetical protein
VKPLVLFARHCFKVVKVIVALVLILVVNDPSLGDWTLVALIDDPVSEPAADVLVAHTKSPTLMSPAEIHWSPTSIG